MPITAIDLLRFQALSNSYLPDQVTFARTGVTVNCRIEPAGRDIPIEGLSDLLKVARMQMTLPFDYPVGSGTRLDVIAGDTATVAGKGLYFVIGSADPEGYEVDTQTHVIAIGTPVIASTLRPEGPKTQGQTSAYVTHLTGVQLVPLAGQLFRPLADQEEADSFGVSLAQAQKVMALWPAGATEPFPIRAGDALVLPTGEKYRVMGERTYQNAFIDLVISRTTTQT